MPSPGDSNNLKFNLTTLAQLNYKQTGSKLSYDKITGRFSIQEPGINQTLARTFSPNSVASEEFFGAPIRELFAAAHVEIGKQEGALVKKNEFDKAVDGLKALCDSYGKENQKDKLAILNAVIEDAKLGVKRDPDYVIELRKRYQQYLKFGFAQVMFLQGSNAGVCYSFTTHWARRILLGKTYFGISKKKPNTEANPLTLDSEQKTRIMKKVDKVIRPMQDALLESKSTAFGTGIMIYGKSKEPFARYYSDLIVAPFTKDKQQIAATASGSEFMEAVLKETELRTSKLVSIFLVNLGKKGEGHTIGIHLDGALHFFDPNIGEFAFPTGSDEKLKSFLDDWWKEFYMERDPSGLVQHFQSWALESVTLNPNQ